MYSSEIDDILKYHQFFISSKLYLEIFDIKRTPQISEIKYNSYDDNFFVKTKDNYNWTFKVYKEV